MVGAGPIGGRFNFKGKISGEPRQSDLNDLKALREKQQLEVAMNSKMPEKDSEELLVPVKPDDSLSEAALKQRAERNM